MTQENDFFIVVDVETAGPNPSTYAMLSIGAVCLSAMDRQFYIELKPDKRAFTEEALQICHLSLEYLALEGARPEAAMRRFADWVEAVLPAGARPVFTAFNAPFDWMFVNDYFYRYLGSNPFGHNALDIKAFYMGSQKTSWSETSHRYISERYPESHVLTHHALEDAINEAHLFHILMTACDYPNRKA